MGVSIFSTLPSNIFSTLLSFMGLLWMCIRKLCIEWRKGCQKSQLKAKILPFQYSSRFIWVPLCLRLQENNEILWRKDKLMINSRVNFIGMNFKKYFFFLEDKRYFQVSTAVIQMQYNKCSCNSCYCQCESLSVCLAAKPVMILCSPVYSPKLLSVLAKAKLFRSPAVRDMKSGSEFSYVHCTAFQL